MKKGILKQNGVHLRDHEYSTVKLLLENGYDVELIPASTITGLKMPDLMMNGVSWEMKAPIGSGKNTIRHIIKKACHQSNNIIIDLRRSSINEDQAIKELKEYYRLSKRLRRMKIVTKSGEILDFSK